MGKAGSKLGFVEQILERSKTHPQQDQSKSLANNNNSNTINGSNNYDTSSYNSSEQSSNDFNSLDARFSQIQDDNKSELQKFFTEIFAREVEISEGLSTLFRGNCPACRVMANCFRRFGSSYLETLLAPISEQRDTSISDISYEIDSTRLEACADIDVNQRNLLKLTKEILDSVLISAPYFPPQISTMCISLRKVLRKKYPDKDLDLRAVRTVIFLRFINPAIVAPYEAGIVSTQPPAKTLRGLKLVSKILQNIANNVEFSKEEHMLPFNDFVRAQFEPITIWTSRISSELDLTSSKDQCNHKNVSYVTYEADHSRR